MRSAYFSYFSKEDVKYWNQSTASLKRRARAFGWKKRIIYYATKNINTKYINMNNKTKTAKEILQYSQAFISSEFETNHILFVSKFFLFSNVLDAFYYFSNYLVRVKNKWQNELCTEEKMARCCNFIGIYSKRFTERYQIFIEIITISIHFMKRIVWLGVE